MAEVHTRQGGRKCPQRPPRRTSRPGWGAGVPTTGRRRRSAGSRFVVVAFALGMAGTKSIDPNTAGPRESGRMDRILDAGFKRPAAESVLIQSRKLSTTDAAFTAAVGDVVARLSKLDSRAERSHRAGLPRRTLGAGRVRDPRRSRRGGREDRSGSRPGRRRPEGASAALRRRVRHGQRGRRARDDRRAGPRQGRDAVAPDHARHPRDRVRRSRRRGDPVAARPDGRLRDLRRRRRDQPRLPDGERGRCARAPDRARRRRRLLALLPEA